MVREFREELKKEVYSGSLSRSRTRTLRRLLLVQGLLEEGLLEESLLQGCVLVQLRL